MWCRVLGFGPGLILTCLLACVAGCGADGDASGGTPAGPVAGPEGPAGPTGQGPPPGGDGCPRAFAPPTDKVLLRARSADGLAWEKLPDVLVEGGSSPQLVRLGGRREVIFVQDGEYLARVPFDGGRAENIEIRGADQGWQVDPHLVSLPDGGYRLYYIHPPEEVDPGVLARNAVHSARSEDGKSWRKESGIRLEGELVDPDVVRLDDGRWRMFYTLRTAFVHSAVSSDGLAFVSEEGARFQGGGVTSTLKVDDLWGMYLHQPTNPPSKLLLATSADGLSFAQHGEPILRPEPDGIDRCGLESPSVLRDEEGWWMVYAVAPPTGGGGP